MGGCDGRPVRCKSVGAVKDSSVASGQFWCAIAIENQSVALMLCQRCCRVLIGNMVVPRTSEPIEASLRNCLAANATELASSESAMHASLMFWVASMDANSFVNFAKEILQ